MSAKRACLECRAKKVRCLPSARRCVRCVNMGIEVCIYNQVKKRGVGKMLRMGEACERCRTKKKKCDAGHPCAGCLETGGASECIYDSRIRPRVHSTAHPLQETSCPVGPPASTLAPLPTDDVPVDLLIPAEPGLLPPTSDVTQAVTYELSPLSGLKVASVLRGCSSGLILSGRNSPERHLSSDTNPFIFITSLLPPQIPREPWMSLSLLGEGRLQISDVDTTGLDMISRWWVLLRLQKFGIQLKSERLNALVAGDQSGTVLDRFWVTWSHALGMSFCLRMDATPSLVRLQARLAQLAWESLVELVNGNDYVLKARATLMVAATYLYVHRIHASFLYIQKSCDHIKAGNLGFIPTYGRPPEFSEELHESLSVFSQTIYWANYLFLTCGGQEPHATAKLEKEFRQGLPHTYPFLFKICPLTMRTQGILFVRDVIMLLGVRPVDGGGQGFWRQSCDQVLASLEDFSQNLSKNIQSFREQGDESGTEAISSSCVACLAHLAILYEAVCRTDTTMYGLCDSALQRLGMITSEHHTDEYTNHDLLLGESWKKSLPVFDLRIASLPPQESESLRHFRKVVEEKYVEFQTRLPDSDPPDMVTLVLSEDGTTKDSKYPNFLLIEVRTLYGI